MSLSNSLDHASLLRLLHYDPETGVFTRLVTTASRAKAGSEAGCRTTRNSRHRCAYRHIMIGGKRYRAHRLAWFYMTGEWPPNEVDHIDGDGLNNRWANLREATCTQNHANVPRRIHNTTGFKGVCFCKAAKKFRAQITVNGKRIWLGFHDAPEAAHAAYAAAAEKHFGEFARVG